MKIKESKQINKKFYKFLTEVLMPNFIDSIEEHFAENKKFKDAKFYVFPTIHFGSRFKDGKKSGHMGAHLSIMPNSQKHRKILIAEYEDRIHELKESWDKQHFKECKECKELKDKTDDFEKLMQEHKKHGDNRHIG